MAGQFPAVPHEYPGGDFLRKPQVGQGGCFLYGQFPLGTTREPSFLSFISGSLLQQIHQLLGQGGDFLRDPQLGQGGRNFQ